MTPGCATKLVFITVSALASFLLLLPIGCGGDADDGEGEVVVATTTMLGDLANELLKGTDVEVHTLIRPGVDPHSYELNTVEAKRLQSANFVIYNGLNLEGKMGQVLESLPDTLAAGELVPEERRIGAAQFGGAYDPHLWMDVGLWGEYVVGGLASRLAERYPQHAAQIQENAAAYQAKLAQLDDYARRAMALIPEDRRILITAHDAFSYFGQAYDIDVRGVQGLSTTSEASAKDIQNLVDLIVERQIPAVFVESSVSPKNLQKLQESVEQRGRELELAPAIFSDSTGEAGTFEGTYLGMLDHNITVIATELGAPGVDIHGTFGQLTLGHDHEDEAHAGESHADHADHN